MSWVGFLPKNQLLAASAVVTAVHFLLKWTYSFQKVPELSSFKKCLFTNSLSGFAERTVRFIYSMFSESAVKWIVFRPCLRFNFPRLNALVHQNTG